MLCLGNNESLPLLGLCLLLSKEKLPRRKRPATHSACVERFGRSAKPDWKTKLWLETLRRDYPDIGQLLLYSGDGETTTRTGHHAMRRLDIPVLLHHRKDNRLVR